MTTDAAIQETRLNADLWKFLSGQAISVLGSSFTGFALPLLIFQLTHSALNLAITTAAFAVPNLLFGLVIGAWVDRVDRKRLMIAVDVLLAAVIASVPALALTGHLSVWYIYAAQFVGATLFLIFQQAEFTAIPSLVPQLSLVTANGRINGTYQAASIIGPVLAGGLVALVPVSSLLFIDAASYLVSAAALASIAVSFNRSADRERPRTSIRADIGEGLRYVIGHPVLRNISLMMMLFNLVDSSTYAQSVLYAKVRLHATNPELGVFFAAGGVGAVIFSFLAGHIRRRFSFSQVVLGCLMANGLSVLAFSFIPLFWPALPFLVLSYGFGSLLNINTFSLRQAIVPNEMLGRVLSVAGVLAFSAAPLGSLAGGYLIQRTHHVEWVFAGIGALLFLIPLAFTRTALGHADRYLPPEARATAQA